jgi:hypothetical protein
MRLSQHPADARAIVPKHDEKIVNFESHLRQLVDDLDVGEPLPVGADFILAFYDQDAAGFQHTKRFPRAAEIQVQHRLVVLLGRMGDAVVVVVLFVVLVVLVRRSPWRVHIWRIKHDAVNHAVAIRQLPAVNTGGQIGRAEIVCTGPDVLPEDPLAIRHVRNEAAFRDVQGEHVREYLVIGSLIGGEDEFIGCNATRNPVRLLRPNGCGALGDHCSCLRSVRGYRCDRHAPPRRVG